MRAWSARLVLIACLAALTACAGAPVRQGQLHPSAAPSAMLPSPTAGGAGPITFSRLEGVYRQGNRFFVVTYQGWWLDTRSQEIRQLVPLGGGEFGYGPGWQRLTPTQGRLHFAVDGSGNGAKVTGIAPGGLTVAAVRVSATARDVHIRSDGAVLAGTLTIPAGPSPRPGIVIVQGSGPLDRHFESISQGIYLSLGFAVLAFDKRGTGASTGVFPGELATTESIGIQAGDAAAAARFLMLQPGIDPRQVGFDGNSQGGWVVPLAAEQVPGLKFAVLIAAPAVTTSQQREYASFSGGSQYVPTESNTAVDAAVRSTSGGYDPAPVLARFRRPAIWVYGQLDRQVPVRICVQNLARYHNPLWTVDVLADGSHGLIQTRHGLDSELPGATRFAGDYLAAIRVWVARHITFPR
jgi:uncharacterized protein